MKCQERLFDILHDLQGLTIAVSGGVDSTLLAYIANLVLGQTVKMVHAISPAVPIAADASRRWRGGLPTHLPRPSAAEPLRLLVGIAGAKTP